MSVCRRARSGPWRLAAVALVLAGPLWMQAQQMAAKSPQTASLPDAPAVSPGVSSGGTAANTQSAPATVAGTVLDTNGSEVQGADVLLTRDGAKVSELQTGGNGEFSFAGLPPGEFQLAVSGQGLGTIHRSLQVKAGDFLIVPHLRLPVEGVTSVVRVVANPETVSEEQVSIAVHQRVLGVFPNFYSTYDWHAPPMKPKQKFQLALRSLVDPVTFFTVGAVAGAEQYKNIFPGFGQGAQGYAKRYGAAFADDAAERILGNALLPAVFHQDPRYFYKGSGSLHSRFFYALAAALITRGDNGHWEPNYSHVLGSFAAGGISNLYYPSSSRGVSLMAVNGAIGIASNAGENVLREFVLKRFTTHSSDGTNP
ncbi:MAG TPA: carboxypeptidase-like regulatory domain-containing protein [Terracidiphilus sp.]|nr:carboxypeptidase-like regulatory domain-containing protein [Terracidiphilus sp.]